MANGSAWRHCELTRRRFLLNRAALDKETEQEAYDEAAGGSPCRCQSLGRPKCCLGTRAEELLRFADLLNDREALEPALAPHSLHLRPFGSTGSLREGRADWRRGLPQS